VIERGIDPRCGSGKFLDETFLKGGRGRVPRPDGRGNLAEVDLPRYDRRSALLVMSDANADDNCTKQDEKEG
jgi:hypothetical protein